MNSPADAAGGRADPAAGVVLGTLSLPGEGRSASRARAFLRGLLPPDDPVLDDLLTVGSETVGNAVAHTASGRPGGRVEVRLAAVAGGYRLEVADDGAAGGRPHVRPGSDDDLLEDLVFGAESGRGMRIVAALASAWGYWARGERTVVWAEFAPARPSGPGLCAAGSVDGLVDPG
ncbi:ATP-binding protein [Actinomadura atramentaria]|uniref:ATP-binding protein n=1 Tax=Actinomadura atramentaria TaxID=1990 RepID=UPI00036617C8|nr:ATP-binding protein [Actinomadura atramentaria]